MKLTCEWCGEAFERPGTRGPRPKFCSGAHRQRAHQWRRQAGRRRQAGQIVIVLGDQDSPYPPVLAAEDVEPLRRWFGKHITWACWQGDHTCAGVCALHSDVVDERPCLCPCHSTRGIT